jgi:hypothetical protein
MKLKPTFAPATRFPVPVWPLWAVAPMTEAETALRRQHEQQEQAALKRWTRKESE